MRDHHRVGVKNEGALPIIVMVLVSLVDQPRLVRKITFITYFVKHIKLFSSHVSCLVIVKAGSSVFFHCIGPHVLQSFCFFSIWLHLQKWQKAKWRVSSPSQLQCHLVSIQHTHKRKAALGSSSSSGRQAVMDRPLWGILTFLRDPHKVTEVAPPWSNYTLMAFPSTCQETHRCALALIRVSVLRKQGRQVREEMESWSRGVPPVLKNNDNDNRNLHPMHCNALGVNNRRLRAPATSCRTPGEWKWRPLHRGHTHVVPAHMCFSWL